MARGGARPGAGRKPTRERYESPIQQAEQRAADRLIRNVDTLQALADGGLETVHEEYAPAGLVTTDDVEIDGDGRVVKVKRLAFPDLPPDQLVLVKRRVVTNGPSESAAIYLIDRIAGKPTQTQEISGPDGGAIEIEDADRKQAEAELSSWREEMLAQLKAWQGQAPTT